MSYFYYEIKVNYLGKILYIQNTYCDSMRILKSVTPMNNSRKIRSMVLFCKLANKKF